MPGVLTTYSGDLVTAYGEIIYMHLSVSPNFQSEFLTPGMPEGGNPGYGLNFRSRLCSCEQKEDSSAENCDSGPSWGRDLAHLRQHALGPDARTWLPAPRAPHGSAYTGDTS